MIQENRGTIVRLCWPIKGWT